MRMGRPFRFRFRGNRHQILPRPCNPQRMLLHRRYPFWVDVRSVPRDWREKGFRVNSFSPPFALQPCEMRMYVRTACCVLRASYFVLRITYVRWQAVWEKGRQVRSSACRQCQCKGGAPFRFRFRVSEKGRASHPRLRSNSTVYLRVIGVF